jgi:organic radical activating enzyme
VRNALKRNGKNIKKRVNKKGIVSMKKTARVIITFACNRKCSYCCNNYTSIINNATHIQDLNALKDYPEICITGGEPMLNPQRTKDIISKLRDQNPQAVIYLYTARYHEQLSEICTLVDGIHFTLHEKSTVEDINDFIKFQNILIQRRNTDRNKSYRLYIHHNMSNFVVLFPKVWSRVEVKEWLSEGECELPVNETLFILEK